MRIRMRSGGTLGLATGSFGNGAGQARGLRTREEFRAAHHHQGAAQRAHADHYL